jgi:hypothetical protein
MEIEEVTERRFYDGARDAQTLREDVSQPNSQ